MNFYNYFSLYFEIDCNIFSGNILRFILKKLIIVFLFTSSKIDINFTDALKNHKSIILNFSI